MSAAALVENLLRLALLLAGLLLPGALLLRALRLPASLAGAFTGSAVLLYTLVVGLGAAGLPISAVTLGLGLALFSAAARLVPVRGAPAGVAPWHACFTRLGAWTALCALFWLVAGWRLATQPLTGPDVYFRWSWLAEQIVQHGGLGFYPPRSGADFAGYYWAESVPPGVASLYAWAYACGGSTHALWTSPVVALQLLAVHELVWRLGSRWGGEVVARHAVVLAAATPLLAWSVLIGQETGLTALAVCGLAWSLAHLADDDGARWAVLAGIFAAAAAGAREYGAAFAGAAVLIGALTAPPRRALVLAAVALPLSLAWPLRVWLLTGNPFHSLDVGGLFPVNAVFVAWQQVFHAPQAGRLATVADWLGLGRYLLLWALPALVGAAALAAALGRRQRGAQVPAVLIALSVGLWWVSLAYTAGGLFYSLRVLSPAFALLAVPAAYGLTRWLPAGAAPFTAAALAVLLVESLPKTLVLPQNPYKTAAAGWPEAGRAFSDAVRAGEQTVLAAVTPLPGVRRIVTDNASFARVFGAAGLEAVPPWSPDVAWLFDATLPPEDLARRWQQSGLRYLVLGKSPSGADFVLSRACWRAPYFTVRTLAEVDNNLLIEATAAPP